MGCDEGEPTAPERLSNILAKLRKLQSLVLFPPLPPAPRFYELNGPCRYAYSQRTL
jgi:hypothetical protein